MDPGGFGRAQQGSQVLRILDQIENQHEEGFMFFHCPVQNVIQGGVSISTGFQGHPLVVLTQWIEARARDPIYRQLVFGCQFENLSQAAFFLNALRNQQAEKLAPVGTQHFINRVSTGNPFFHCYCTGSCEKVSNSETIFAWLGSYLFRVSLYKFLLRAAFSVLVKSLVASAYS